MRGLSRHVLKGSALPLRDVRPIEWPGRASVPDGSAPIRGPAGPSEDSGERVGARRWADGEAPMRRPVDLEDLSFRYAGNRIRLP